MPLSLDFHRRFVVLSGKGGVGKSTLAAALALRNAREGRRTCVVQLNTRDAIGPIFGLSEPVGYEPTRLHPKLPLWSVDLRPGPALREYGLMKLRFRALHRVVFENDVMRRLLGMIPGMMETLLLGKAWFMESVEIDEAGRPRWDTLIIDAPSTGHGVSLLRLPQVLLSVVPVGPMADDARQMAALLADPSRTALHIATLPAELPVNEALDLETQARELVGVQPASMLVNQVVDPPGGADVVEAGDRLAERLSSALGDVAARIGADDAAICSGAVDNWRRSEHWRAEQRVQLERLTAATRLPVFWLPHLLAPVDVAGLERLADALMAPPAVPAAPARSVVGAS